MNALVRFRFFTILFLIQLTIPLSSCFKKTSSEGAANQSADPPCSQSIQQSALEIISTFNRYKSVKEKYYNTNLHFLKISGATADLSAFTERLIRNVQNSIQRLGFSDCTIKLSDKNSHVNAKVHMQDIWQQVDRISKELTDRYSWYDWMRKKLPSNEGSDAFDTWIKNSERYFTHDILGSDVDVILKNGVLESEGIPFLQNELAGSSDLIVFVREENLKTINLKSPDVLILGSHKVEKYRDHDGYSNIVYIEELSRKQIDTLSIRSLKK